MTRKKAIKQLVSLLVHCMSMKSDDAPIWDDDSKALEMAISALSPITREQVEKMRGEWIREATPRMLLEHTISHCSKCWSHVYWPTEHTDFCGKCGAPMTDKAVDILWKRLEAMQDEVR